MAKEEEENKKNVEGVQLVDVTTKTAPAFKLPDGSIVDMEDYLVWMGNLIYKINNNTG